MDEDTKYQGMSPDEVALMEGDLDEEGLPKEDTPTNEADDEPTGVKPPKAAPEDADAEDDEQEPDPKAIPEKKEEPEQLEEAPESPPAQRSAAYEVAQVADFKEQRAALRAQESEIEAEWIAGTLNDQQKAEKLGAVRDKLDDLLVQHTRASTLAEANAQHAIQAQREVLTNIAAAAKKAGHVDYDTDAKAQRQFDTALQMVAGDPDNAGRPYRELAAEAHAAVLALRGVQAKPATPAAPDAKTPRRSVDKALIPPTLSRVPPAVDPSISGDEFSHLSNLDGADLEKAVTRMTPEQQERWLNS